MRRGPFFALLAFVCAATRLGAVPSASAEEPAAPASPSPSSESERLVARALDLREAGKDREALPLLSEAAKLDPSPRNRAQLALGQQAMGEWVEAERGLEGVLAPPAAVADRSDRSDPWVDQNRGPLEEALATVRRQLGWLEVEGNVPGALVTLNGVLLGPLPLAGAVRVPTGVSSVKVTAAGYTPVARLVQIAAGEHAREVLSLQLEPAAAPAVEANAPSSVLAESPAHARPAAQTRVAAWAFAAGGAAALATGIVANVARENDADQYNQAATIYNSQCTPPKGCSGPRPSQSDVDIFTGVSVAGYAVGAALGITAAVLFLRAAPPARATARAPISCGVGPFAPVMLACAGAF